MICLRFNVINYCLLYFFGVIPNSSEKAFANFDAFVYPTHSAASSMLMSVFFKSDAAFFILSVRTYDENDVENTDLYAFFIPVGDELNITDIFSSVICSSAWELTYAFILHVSSICDFETV